MVDVYTKAVLTVIAVALSVVAVRSAVPSALAKPGEVSAEVSECIKARVEAYSSLCEPADVLAKGIAIECAPLYGEKPECGGAPSSPCTYRELDYKIRQAKHKPALPR